MVEKIRLSRNYEASFGLHLYAKPIEEFSSIIQISKTTEYQSKQLAMRFLSKNSYTLRIANKGCSAWNNNEDNYSYDLDYGWSTGEFHTVKFRAIPHDTDADASAVFLFIAVMVTRQLFI